MGAGELFCSKNGERERKRKPLEHIYLGDWEEENELAELTQKRDDDDDNSSHRCSQGILEGREGKRYKVMVSWLRRVGSGKRSQWRSQITRNRAAKRRWIDQTFFYLVEQALGSSTYEHIKIKIEIILVYAKRSYILYSFLRPFLISTTVMIFKSSVISSKGKVL